MTKEVKEVIRLHGLYLLGDPTGKRADFSNTDLRYEEFIGVDLQGANLRYTNLEGAYLRGANLRYADFRGAYLRGANLRYTNLEGANLSGANFSDANLEGANLSGTKLRGANLRGANLEPIKKDMFDVLLKAIPEIPALKEAIKSGKIDGSTYEGECACLCGTIEKSDRVKSKYGTSLRDSCRPIERFFLTIYKGDTPENSYNSKLALEWIEEFENDIGVY